MFILVCVHICVCVHVCLCVRMSVCVHVYPCVIVRALTVHQSCLVCMLHWISPTHGTYVDVVLEDDDTQTCVLQHVCVDVVNVLLFIQWELLYLLYI